jgi:hypothetical protein
MLPDFEYIRTAFRQEVYNISRHGFQELLADNITIKFLEIAIGQDSPEIIEHYPLDRRGPCCLILGWVTPSEPIHVCIGYRGDKPDVIIAYKPDPNIWIEGYRQRRGTYGNE